VLNAALLGTLRSLEIQRQDSVLIPSELLEAQLFSLIPLAAGARLILPCSVPEGCGDPSGATVLVMTPGRAGSLLTAGWNGTGRLRSVVCGGAPLSRGLADQLRKGGVEVWSLYGMGESAGWFAARRIEAREEPVDADPSGRGIQLQVLDRAMAPQPIGVPGEVWLAGATLACGYLGHPDSTAERFVPDPFSGTSGSRLFRTGDLARRLPGGGLELLGRADRRRTIRGQSVSLGEIEAVLRRHADLYEAVVEPWTEPDGATRLIAYLAISRERAPDPGRLRRDLQRTLPEPMVPTTFALLDSLPMTPQGRVDRDALPPPSALGEALREALVPPRTPQELSLLRIWEDLFGCRPLGVTDDFFALGGHSLLALKLRARIRSELGKDLPLTALLRSPTIESLAGILARTDRAAGSPATCCLVPIQTVGSLPPLFAVHPAGGGVLCYVELAYRLGDRRPFYGLQAPGWEDEREPFSAIEPLVDLYLAELRKAQPRGPYHLLGWSFGGFVAYEMARRLAALGETVPFLAILDAGISRTTEAPPSDRELLRSLLGDDAPATEEELRALGDFDQQFEHYVALEREANRLPADFEEDKVKRILKVRQAHQRALHAYRPQPYAGRVILLRSAETLARGPADPTLGWGRLALGGVEIYDVPGSHSDLVKPPGVRAVAQHLALCLDRPSPATSSPTAVVSDSWTGPAE
jgi:thioesterase domain-containing protein